MIRSRHESRDVAGPRRATSDTSAAALGRYLLAGALFGLVLTKSEVVSWFRIQEMFRFQSFHMYGIIMSAVAVAAVSLAVLRRLRVSSLQGELIRMEPKTLGRGTRYWLGGSVFGLGWSLTGACPGPLFALVGAGVPVIIVAIATAVLGTWVYGQVRTHLPH